MIYISLLLIICSAICHATWNILAKKSVDKLSFMWLQMIVNIVLLGAPILFFFGFPPVKALPFLLMSGILQAIYYLLLAKSYTIGEVSLVYPLARGSAPMFVCLFSTILGIEHITFPMFLSILIIVFGIYTVNMRDFKKEYLFEPFYALKKYPATRFSLLSGVIIACYTIVDKMSVSNASPFVVFYIITVIPCLLLAPFMIKRGKYIEEIKQNKFRIILVALLTFAAYALVLISMKGSHVSYVSSIREISVVFVAIYYTITSKEKNWKCKIISSVLIFIGIVSLSVLSH